MDSEKSSFTRTLSGKVAASVMVAARIIASRRMLDVPRWDVGGGLRGLREDRVDDQTDSDLRFIDLRAEIDSVLCDVGATAPGPLLVREKLGASSR